MDLDNISKGSRRGRWLEHIEEAGLSCVRSKSTTWAAFPGRSGELRLTEVTAAAMEAMEEEDG